jgi:hypothetical protein
LRYQLTDWDMEGLKTYLDAVLGEKRTPLEFLEVAEVKVGR